MKSNALPLIAVFAVTLAVLLAINAQNTTTAALNAPSTQWEPLAMSVDATNGIGDADTSRQIVQLGNDGWELVGVENFVKERTTTKLAYFLKRPK